MAKQYLQAFDPQKAAFNSTDYYTCRVVVPFAHKLTKATVYTQNTVTTGTVEIFLKKVDVGDARGGAIIATKLNNTDIDAATSINKQLVFVLSSAYDGTTAPADRQYYIVLTGTNSADRFDELTLVLTVEDV